MQCDPGCGLCCGIAPATEEELSRIKSYVKLKGITPVDQGITCPVYLNGTCAVYPVRPLACKLFGHTARMACPHGYNVNMPEREVLKLIKRNGKAKRKVHDILPGFNLEAFLSQFQEGSEALATLLKEISGPTPGSGV